MNEKNKRNNYWTLIEYKTCKKMRTQGHSVGSNLQGANLNYREGAQNMIKLTSLLDPVECGQTFPREANNFAWGTLLLQPIPTLWFFKGIFVFIDRKYMSKLSVRASFHLIMSHMNILKESQWKSKIIFCRRGFSKHAKNAILSTAFGTLRILFESQPYKYFEISSKVPRITQKLRPQKTYLKKKSHTVMYSLALQNFEVPMFRQITTYTKENQATDPCELPLEPRIDIIYIFASISIFISPLERSIRQQKNSIFQIATIRSQFSEG